MIRLLRVGRKHDPSFRVVVTDKKNSTKSGRFIEIVGTYDARIDKAVFEAEAIKKWIANGAQPSGTVHNLLVDAKIIDSKKRNVLARRKVVKAPEVKQEVKAEEAPATN